MPSSIPNSKIPPFGITKGHNVFDDFLPVNLLGSNRQ